MDVESGDSSKDRSLWTTARVALTLAALGAGSGSVWGLDSSPTDYLQLPDGTDAAVVYMRHGVRDELRVKDVGDIADSHLESDVVLARYVHFFEVGGIMVDPQVIIPYGSLHAGRIGGRDLKSTTGFGDPLLATIFGLVNDPENGRFIGVGAGLFVPIGQYTEGATLNMGENRWRGVLQLGLSQGIPGDLRLDMTLDTTIYGANEAAGTGAQTLTQDRSYQIQPWITYALSPDAAVSVGYSRTLGGDQKVDGNANGLQTNAHQARIRYQHTLTPGLVVSAQASRDLAVQGGFKEDAHFVLTTAKVF